MVCMLKEEGCMHCLTVGMQTVVAVVGNTINVGLIHNGQTHIALKGAGFQKAQGEIETVEIEVEVKGKGVEAVGTGGPIDIAVEIVKGIVGIKAGPVPIRVLVITGHITQIVAVKDTTVTHVTADTVKLLQKNTGRARMGFTRAVQLWIVLVLMGRGGVITGAIGLKGMTILLAGRMMIAAARNALIQNVSIGIGIVDDPAVQSTGQPAGPSKPQQS